MDRKKRRCEVRKGKERNMKGEDREKEGVVKEEERKVN